VRLQPKLAGLPPEARQRVEDVTRLLIEKLLSTPTEHLKSLDDPDTIVAYADALNQLFALNASPAASQADEGTNTSDEGRPAKPDVAVQS